MPGQPIARHYRRISSHDIQGLEELPAVDPVKMDFKAEAERKYS